MKNTVMFLHSLKINDQSSVAEIVAQDYHAADVFRRHGIGYCCGGKWPFNLACEMQGVDPGQVREELEQATRTVQLPRQLAYKEWSIGFLVDYLENIHHYYLRETLPVTLDMLTRFVKEHRKKFNYLEKLEEQFGKLAKQLLLLVQEEEEVLFPYLRQLDHAKKHQEPYAAIFVRTMRKPVEETMGRGHEMITGMVLSIRQLCNLYEAPENACTSHKVILGKLLELDNDLAQHLYLEKYFLFPKVLTIEQVLLNK